MLHNLTWISFRVFYFYSTRKAVLTLETETIFSCVCVCVYNRIIEGKEIPMHTTTKRESDKTKMFKEKENVIENFASFVSLLASGLCVRVCFGPFDLHSKFEQKAQFREYKRDTAWEIKSALSSSCASTKNYRKYVCDDRIHRFLSLFPWPLNRMNQKRVSQLSVMSPKNRKLNRAEQKILRRFTIRSRLIANKSSEKVDYGFAIWSHLY